MKQQLASLQQQKQGEPVSINNAANAAELGTQRMPELAAAQAAAAEAAQQVILLEQKLASAQVMLRSQILFRHDLLAEPLLKACCIQFY